MRAIVGCVFLLVAGLIEAAPSGSFAASGAASSSASSSSGSASGSFQIPFLNFGKDGNVGVNFGGYHASAGLGGLLSGNAAQGGLFAQAGTPHGQKAAAGLGGVVDGESVSQGGLYAGAQSGSNVAAAASLGGAVSGANSVGVSKTVSKTVVAQPVVQKEVIYTQPQIVHDQQPQEVVYYKTKTKIRSRPRHHHFRKFIRYETVPAYTANEAYVEKNLAVQPVYNEVNVQKQYVAPAPAVSSSFSGSFSSAVAAPVAQKTVHVEKTKIIEHPVIHKEVVVEQPVIVKQPATYDSGLSFSASGAASSAASSASASAGSASASSSSGASASSSSGASSGAKYGSGGAGASLGYSSSYSHNFNGGQLLSDIFNIPIATLGAVSRLVGNAASNKSITFNKSVSASYAG